MSLPRFSQPTLERLKRYKLGTLLVVPNLLAIPLLFTLLGILYAMTHEDGGEVILLILGFPFFAAALGVIVMDFSLLSVYVFHAVRVKDYTHPIRKIFAAMGMVSIVALVIVGVEFGIYRQAPKSKTLLTRPQVVNLILDCKVASFVTAANDNNIIWVTYVTPKVPPGTQGQTNRSTEYDDTSSTNYPAMVAAVARATPKCGYISYQR